MRVRTGCWLLAAVLLGGCQASGEVVRAWQGAPLPPSEVVRVVVPDEALEIVAVDGRPYKAPLPPEGVYEVQLLPGGHRLDFVYSQVWGDPSSGSLYVSDRFTFDIRAAAGARYRVVHDGPSDPIDADVADAPVRIWLVEEATGRRIDPVARTPHGGILTQAVRTVAGGGIEAATAAAPADSPEGAPGSGALPRLKEWWRKATPAERAAFRKWIVDHP